MDLRSGLVITRRNLKELPVTELVLQAVENMAIQKVLTTLKFTSRTAPSIYPADWIAGVDYKKDDSGDSYFNQPDIEDQDDVLNEGSYDRIDEAELELGETREEGEESDVDCDGNKVEENNIDVAETKEEIGYHDAAEDESESDPAEEQEEDDPEDVNDTDSDDDTKVDTTHGLLPNVADDEDQSHNETTMRRSTRTITKPSRRSATQVSMKIERKHVILHRTMKDHEQHIEYDISPAVFAAKTIIGINHAVCEKGAGFAQQHIYQKGVNKFGDRGRKPHRMSLTNSTSIGFAALP
jgi:hypothetical protein